MRTGLPQIANRAIRMAIVSIASLTLWSCSTAGSDVYDTAPAYSAADKKNAAAANAADAEANGLVPAAASGQEVAASGENPTGATVASAAAVPVPTSGDRPADIDDEAETPAKTAEAKPAAEASPAEKQAAASDSGDDPANAGDGSVATAVQAAPAPKKTGLFAFFGSKPAGATPTPKRDGSGAPVATSTRNTAMATAPTKLAKETAASAAPTLNMASLDLPGQSTSNARSAGDNGALPGVRQSALFEIKRRSGLDDDSDVDLYEDAPPVQFASAGGMARMSPNGLLKQHDSVDVSCFKPALVRVLKQIESRFGRKLVVTSGYRNPSHNRKVRGAKNSQHMYCAAADIQVEGVSKWDLAKYVRTLPGRGGVGTYCHTESVHVDIGPERDWNWRCRGRRKA